MLDLAILLLMCSLLTSNSALPILRQLGAQQSRSILQSRDLSMVKVWAGLEARKFLQASAESVEDCVKYDQLSPNV